jgi:hypothetical protein
VVKTISAASSPGRENKVKSIKMLGLAALTALMAMAFIGVTSASAGSTQLCTTDPASGCTPLTHVHESTLSGVQGVLKTSILTVKCDVLFLSTKVGALGSPQIIEGKFTYSNCNNGCVVTEENSPVEIKVLKVAGTETSEVTGEGLVHVECGSFIDCLYNGIGLKGTGKGPLAPSAETNGEVSLSNAKVNEEGGSFFCPDTSELTLTTTPLSATYIGS